MLDFWLDCSKAQNFFFLLATLPSQKIVIESLHFDWFPGPFKSAIFFFLYKLFVINKSSVEVACVIDYLLYYFNNAKIMYTIK